MKKSFGALLIFLFISLTVNAQFSRTYWDSIRAISQADHKLMLDQLGIEPSELRPGPSGNPADANAANTDESKAKTYDKLPDPLLFNNGDTVRIKYLRGHVDNSSFPEINVDIELVLGIPGETNKAVPVIMEFGFNRTPAQLARFRRGPQTGPDWKQQLLAKGWGYAILVPGSIQADNGAGLKQGIIGLVNKGESRTPEQWGSLRAWAWGASRAVDYFEADPDVDAGHLGIEGLSRYHWFAGNFIKYAGPLTKNDLPVDAHELVALCAPRPVFISSGSARVEGQWVDAKGMFLGGMHAGPVYRLLGKNDMGAKEFPAQETTLTDGEVAFRQHEGGHSAGPNWPCFIRYACRYFE